MNEDPAKARYFIIQALRWSGMALVVFGLMVVNRKVDLPEVIGYALVVAGLIDALVMPSVLSRMWKSPLP